MLISSPQWPLKVLHNKNPITPKNIFTLKRTLRKTFHSVVIFVLDGGGEKVCCLIFVSIGNNDNNNDNTFYLCLVSPNGTTSVLSVVNMFLALLSQLCSILLHVVGKRHTCCCLFCLLQSQFTQGNWFLLSSLFPPHTPNTSRTMWSMFSSGKSFWWLYFLLSTMVSLFRHWISSLLYFFF